ncbi:tRNA sulfurtransferase [Nanoarchaeota archaeon]
MKALCLISSGFDSPVAAHLMLKNKVDLVAIHFNNRPFTDYRPLDKVKKLIKILEEQFNKKIKLYIIDHGKNLRKIVECERRFTCVLCRRMMFRISQEIAKKENCQVLVTGENLGQVASQTLDNLIVTDKAINIDILRPLLTYEKNDIINLAKKIGTHDASVEASYCCKAVPPNPATKAKLHIIEKVEKSLNIPELVKEAIKHAEIN